MKMNKQVFSTQIAIAFLSAAVFSGTAAAQKLCHQQQYSHPDHDRHWASYAMKLQHTHEAKGWMFGYRYMRMDMEDLLDGTNDITAAQVTGTMMSPGQYQMAPTKMSMDMHMLMAMYGITDRLTVMGMASYRENDMDMVNRAGTRSTMKTDGLGDTTITPVYQLTGDTTVSLGLSLPTGDIDEKVIMMGNVVQAPYPMQLGSGTVDLIPAVTFKRFYERWGWGLEGSAVYRIDDNSNDYSLGNRLNFTASGLYKLTSNIFVNGRLAFSDLGRIDGQDPEVNPTTASTGDPGAQGGSRTDLFFGVSGLLGKGHMINAEIGVPIQQNLNGPQLETETIFSIGYQFWLM